MAKCFAIATLAVLLLIQFAAAGPALVPAGALTKMRRHFASPFGVGKALSQRQLFRAKQDSNDTTTAAPAELPPACANATIIEAAYADMLRTCGDVDAAAVALFDFESGNQSQIPLINRFCNDTCLMKVNALGALLDTCFGAGFGDQLTVLVSGCTSYDGQYCAVRLRVLGRMNCEDQETNTTCTANNRLCRWKKNRCDPWVDSASLDLLCTPCFEQFLLLMSQIANAPDTESPDDSASRRAGAPPKTKAPDQKKIDKANNEQDAMLASMDLLCAKEDDLGYCLPILQGIDEDIFDLDPSSAGASTMAEVENNTAMVCMEATERCLNRQRLSLHRVIQLGADSDFYTCADKAYQQAAYEAWTYNFTEYKLSHPNSTFNGTHIAWKVSPNPYAENPEQGVWYNGTHVIIDVRLVFGPPQPMTRRQSAGDIQKHLNIAPCMQSWEDTMQDTAKSEALADFTCQPNESNQTCLVVVHRLLKNGCFGLCNSTCSAWFQDFVLNQQGCCFAQFHAIVSTADFDHDSAPLLDGNLSNANVTLMADRVPVWDNHPLREVVETCAAEQSTFNLTAVKARLLKVCPGLTAPAPDRDLAIAGLRWDELLSNPKLKAKLEAALKDDLARTLGIPASDIENATFAEDTTQKLSSVKATSRQAGTGATSGSTFKFKTSGKSNAGASKNAAAYDTAKSSGKLSISGTASVIQKKCKTCMGGAAAAPGGTAAPPPTGNLFAALLGKSVSGATTKPSNATTRASSNTTRASNGTTTSATGRTTAPTLAVAPSPAPMVSAMLAAFVAVIVALAF